MDVEALVEAPFVKNGENGHHESPGERSSTPRRNSNTDIASRVASSSKSHHRSPTPTSDYSRHSSRHRRDYDRHRDRDDSRHRRDSDRDYYSRSDSRRRDDRYYEDKDRYDSKRHSDDRYRERDERYRDDRSDRRRSRNNDDDYDDDRHSKRRRENDDREQPRAKSVDDRDQREKSIHAEPEPYTRLHLTQLCDEYLSSREFSPVLTEEERDLRTVFVQQLAARLRTKELIKFFEKAGPVREAQIVKDRVSGRSKG